MDEINALYELLKTRATCEATDKYILFHGTNIMFTEIDLTKASATSDFSGGFYLTNILEQAVDWAGRKRGIQFKVDSLHELAPAYVFKYELLLDNFKKYQMKLKVFEKYSREWLDTVLLGRRHLDVNDVKVEDVSDLLSEYDIIAGPMADNQLNDKFDEYEESPYDRNVLLEKVKMTKENYQVVFKTKKSLNALKSLEKSTRIEF